LPPPTGISAVVASTRDPFEPAGSGLLGAGWPPSIPPLEL